MNRHPKLEECYSSERKVPRSQRRKLTDTGSSQNVYTSFLDTLSLIGTMAEI